MNACAETRELIGAWLDGELSGAREAAVRRHVETCPDCAGESRELQKLTGLLARTVRAELSPVEARRLWQGIEARATGSRPWYAGLGERLGPYFRSPAFAWAVPAVIVLLLAAVYLNSTLSIWPAGGNAFTAVESIDAFGRNVALMREYETKTTVIWLYQNPESENEAGSEGDEKGPAF